MRVVEELIIAIVAFLIYFIPTYIAFKREHNKKWFIFWLNLLLGGTVIIWLLVFVWSIIGEKNHRYFS